MPPLAVVSVEGDVVVVEGDGVGVEGGVEVDGVEVEGGVVSVGVGRLEMKIKSDYHSDYTTNNKNSQKKPKSYSHVCC